MPQTIRTTALILLLAGCADAGDARVDSAPPEEAAPSAATVDVPPEPPPQVAVPGGVVPDKTLDDAVEVTATLAEFSIRLSGDTVEAGNVAVTIQNDGERPHVIEVRGQAGGRWRSTPIRPGASVTLTMPLAMGRYTVSSADSTYADRGMRTVLVVR